MSSVKSACERYWDSAATKRLRFGLCVVLIVDFLFRASQLDQLTEDMDLLQAQLVAKQEQAAAKLAVSEAAAKKGPREGNYALRIAAEAASKAVLMVQDKVRAKTGGW